MKINKSKANGIIIELDDCTYCKAVKKPNVDCKIIYEIWFKGTIKKLKENKIRK